MLKIHRMEICFSDKHRINILFANKKTKIKHRMEKVLLINIEQMFFSDVHGIDMYFVDKLSMDIFFIDENTMKIFFC